MIRLDDVVREEKEINRIFDVAGLSKYSGSITKNITTSLYNHNLLYDMIKI